MVPETGFRACTEAQWERLTSGEDLINPIACEYNDAQWDGLDAFVIRVEHNRECEAVCTAHGCAEQAVCVSEIATIADDGEQLRWVSNESSLDSDRSLGELLEPALGFDPTLMASFDLQDEAALQIVSQGDDLCVRVSPPPPLTGSFTDCGDAMTDVDLDYVDGMLPFDEAVAVAEPLLARTETWHRGNVALVFVDDDVEQSRWTFLVNGDTVTVDMQGRAFSSEL